MLFYEPLFLTVFPAVYAIYLLAGGLSPRKWILLIASTPLAGAHYVVDLIGGAAVAFAAIFATSRLVRMPPANVDERSKPKEQEIIRSSLLPSMRDGKQRFAVKADPDPNPPAPLLT